MSAPSRSSVEEDVDPFLVAQFDRAVELVQTLPKNGAIQSSYEEKLGLYSLYKQVTEGDVSGSRPGMFELLARSKWDAWKSREKMTRDQAMSAYVNVLLKMLRRYKDRQEARNILHEFRQARAVAAASSIGSQDWQLESSSSYIGSSSCHSSSGSSSSGPSSSSPPAPIPPHLPSFAATSSDPTPRPTPAASRFFEIPDPSLPPPDLSPPYQPTNLPGPSTSSVPTLQKLGLPAASNADDEQPTAHPSRAPSHRSLPPPSPLPSPPIRPPLLPTTSIDSQAFSIALERIQTSLSALHERLELLETATLQDDQRAHPLRTLLFPPCKGRQVGVTRLLWTLFKRTVGDVVLAVTFVSVWLLISSQRGMRRSSVREFWAAIVRLLWRKCEPVARAAAPYDLRSRRRAGEVGQG